MVERDDLALSLSNCLSGFTHFVICHWRHSAVWVCCSRRASAAVVGTQDGSTSRQCWCPLCRARQLVIATSYDAVELMRRGVQNACLGFRV